MDAIIIHQTFDNIFYFFRIYSFYKK